MISRQVTSSGLSLSATPSGDVDILLDTARVHDFVTLRTPVSKEEVRSLLWLLVIFKKWVPGIARDTTILQQLVMKGVKFAWDEHIHGKEMEVIGGKMKNLLPLSPFNPALASHVFTDVSL